MQIRYFATNRDRHNLGRNVNRGTRIKLQKGGYHWVDMKKYMAHYLATTNPSSMPPEVIIENSDEIVFNNFLGKNSIQTIIIGIHGYNVPFHGALTSFSVLADSLKIAFQQRNITLLTDPDETEYLNLNGANQNAIAFIGFSWPANGNVLDYEADRAECVKTAPALANLISCIRKQKPGIKIHIIGHSMGNYLACHMLSGLVNEVFKPTYSDDKIEQQLKRIDYGGENAFFVDRYIMLAPDVERREVTKCNANSLEDNNFNLKSRENNVEYIGPFYSGLENLVQETHLFYSRYDLALKTSVVEKEAREELQKFSEVITGRDLQKRWESSLGLNPAPALAPKNMYSHNASMLSNRSIDHGDYFDTPAIINKIVDIIIAADK